MRITSQNSDRKSVASHRRTRDKPHHLGQSKTMIDVERTRGIDELLINENFTPSPMIAIIGAWTVSTSTQRTDSENLLSTSDVPHQFTHYDSGTIDLLNTDEQALEFDDGSSTEDVPDPDEHSNSFLFESDGLDFAKELEERIQAAQELETIFWSIPQARSLSLGKSVPERPWNPIINDKFFREQDCDNLSMPNSKISLQRDRHAYMSKYRDCSIERQRIILQEDIEAVNEINQLLLCQDNNVSSRSKTSVSELSSLEEDFLPSRSSVFIDDFLGKLYFFAILKMFESFLKNLRLANAFVG